MVKKSQTERLFALLSDNKPHRVDEIIQVVYNMSGTTIARVGARIYDLKKAGLDIESWPDPEQKTLWFYRLNKKAQQKELTL